MKSIKDLTFCIVDIETTGSSAVHDRILEIAIIKVKEGRVVDTFNTLLNPETYVSPYITAITGITSDDVAGSPTFESIALELQEFLQGCVFVAHNARFDYGFVKNEFRRFGIKFASKCLCTVRLSRKLFPRHKSHNLDAIIERFDISCVGRHRAYGDAKATLDFMIKAPKKVKKGVFEEAVRNVLEHRSLPPNLKADMIAHLPDTAGVYIFYNEAGDVLYVGKSKNIKTRVLSHFSSDHRANKEMAISQEVFKIEAIETPGELGALLLESELIKSMTPAHNRLSRKVKMLVIAKKSVDEEGYIRVQLVRADAVEDHDFANTLGIFKNIAQGKEYLKKIAREHGLCGKLLGIEDCKGPCFYTQLDQCLGACTGKEDALAYNTRVLKAFKTRRLKAWPYDGAIVIKEAKNEFEGDLFVVDNWSLVSVCGYSEEGVGEEKRYSKAFDYDAYKILARYILDPVNKRNIELVSKKEIASAMRYEDGEYATIS